MSTHACTLCGIYTAPGDRARGLCLPCYNGARRRGLTEGFALTGATVPRAEVVDEYARPGATYASVGVRLGMRPDAVRKAIRRAQADSVAA